MGSGLALGGAAAGDSHQQMRILSMPLGSGKQRYNRKSHQPTNMRAEVAAMADGITQVLGKIEGHQFDTQVRQGSVLCICVSTSSESTIANEAITGLNQISIENQHSFLFMGIFFFTSFPLLLFLLLMAAPSC